MSTLMALKSDDFEEKVLRADKPVLIEFGAPWCQPCRQLEPELEKLAQTYAGKAAFYSLNVDEVPDLVMAYGVMAVPTTILFRDGEPVQRISGFRPMRALEKAFFADIQ